MAERVYLIDDVTGKHKRGPTVASLGGVTYLDTATINFTFDNILGELEADVIIGGIIEDTITDGETQKAPTSNAVFDALAQKRGVADALFSDEDFDIVNNSTSVLALATDISPTTKIDVYVNGVMVREGATQSYERDATNNEIEFNANLPDNSWVRVRIFA